MTVRWCSCSLLSSLFCIAVSAAVALVVTLGPPFINSVSFLKLHTGNVSTPAWPAHSTVSFGVFGFTGSEAHFGYDPRRWGGGDSFDTNMSATVAHCTRALWVHPATAACACLAFFFGLLALPPSATLRRVCCTLLSIFAGLGSFFAGLGFTIDFIIWTLIQKKIADKAFARSASIGPASYIMVIGTVFGAVGAALGGYAAVEADDDEEDEGPVVPDSAVQRSSALSADRKTEV